MDGEVEPITFASMVGSAPEFRAALELAKEVAAGDQNILIEGEVRHGQEYARARDPRGIATLTDEAGDNPHRRGK